ncbi:MAG TPA: TetR/AcrR family transcriptional regulator [Parasegetibacter sp.]
MKPVGDIKREQIVEAAIKRFAHFGIAKTTLTEIARDLGISKQTLAYYFSDKTQLFQSALERIAADYIDAVRSSISEADTVARALQKMVKIKRLFFERYFIIVSETDVSDSALSSANPRFKELIRERELAVLYPLFKKGVKSGELRSIDVEKTSDLLLEALYAFARTVLLNGGLPDEAAFKEAYANQKDLVSVFYEGIKNKSVN